MFRGQASCYQLRDAVFVESSLLPPPTARLELLEEASYMVLVRVDVKTSFPRLRNLASWHGAAAPRRYVRSFPLFKVRTLLVDRPLRRWRI